MAQDFYIGQIYDTAELHAARQALRDEINKLER